MSISNSQFRGWDWLVRLTHWSVASLFIANYFFTEPGEALHTNFGWIILGLVGLRLLWGLTLAKGPNHLRSFVPTPKGALHHLKELRDGTPPEKVGHNPLGSAAVYLMWIGLAAASLTGWGMDTDWGFENDLDRWHFRVVDWLFILVVVHLSAVLLTSLRLKTNLVKAMIAGRH